MIGVTVFILDSIYFSITYIVKYSIYKSATGKIDTSQPWIYSSSHHCLVQVYFKQLKTAIVTTGTFKPQWNFFSADYIRCMDVSVGMTETDQKLCYHFVGPATNDKIIINCHDKLVGRFVKLTVPKPTKDQSLQFVEIEVYASM